MFPWFEFGVKTKSAIEAGTKAARTIETAVTAVTDAAKTFDPKIRGVSVLTPALRSKLASALGHLAFNINAATNGRPVQ